MQDNKQIQNKEKDADKETKKTMDSYFEVLKHKLGRTPNMTELIDFASNMQQVQQNPALPQGSEPLAKDPSLEKTDTVNLINKPILMICHLSST